MKWNPDTQHNCSTQHLRNAAGIPPNKIARGFFNKRRSNNNNTIYKQQRTIHRQTVTQIHTLGRCIKVDKKTKY